MKKSILLAILLFSFSYFAESQMQWLLQEDWSVEQYYRMQHIMEELRHSKHSDILQVGREPKNYDILSYDFSLDWYALLQYGKDNPNPRIWEGSVSINVASKIDGLEEILLDAIGLEILEVRLDAVSISNFQVGDTTLTIPLTTPLNKNEAVNLNIHYRYSNPENIGFNLYYGGDSYDGRKVEENIAYTINSPEYARFWFPCNDSPSDKAATSMNIQVPLGYSVASNGILNSIDTIFSEDGKNIATYHWSDTTPCATFVINATASKFEEYTEYFKSPNITDSIPIQYYIWANDIDGYVYSAKNTLKRTGQILEFLSDLFIDYPFCKYGTVEAYPFIYSAMENQTMTMVNKYILQTTLGLGNTVAHEIGHQWFGDLVSSKNWDDIWFKEGGATWVEALWSEERTGSESSYYSTMYQEAITYFNQPTLFTKPIHGNPPNLIFESPYVYLTYNKASWIYHSLNCFLGRELNINIIKELLNTYKYGNIDAVEFIEFYKNYTKNMELDFNIDTFFNQWLYGAGHPKYDCQSVKNKDLSQIDTVLYNVSLVVTQTQNAENVADVFQVPIYIDFIKDKKIIHQERRINNQRVQEYNFTNIPEFDVCKVDTLRLLCQNVSVSSIEDSKQNLTLYPNPAINQNFIYLSAENLDMDVTIVNSLGIKVNAPVIRLSKQIQIDISNFPQGMYIVKCNKHTYSFMVIR